jgi:hypothetical protein
MSHENKAIHREHPRRAGVSRSDGLGEIPQTIVYQLIHAAREQCREVVVVMPEPVAAREQGEGRPRSASEIEAAAHDLVGKRHRATLLGEAVQENHDVHRCDRQRDLVPAQEQIRLGAGMRPQHRRVAEIGLAR